MTTPNLNLPEIAQNSFNLAPAYNSSMQIVDALFPLVVQSMTVTAPPATVLGDVGKRWIPATGATGAWAGQAGKVALCVGVNLWAFIAPPQYITAKNLADGSTYQYVTTTWTAIGSGYSGALLSKTVIQSIANATEVAISWDSANETGEWWDVGQPTRMTVPSGVSHAKIIAQVRIVANAVGIRGILIKKNGLATYAGYARVFANPPSTGDAGLAAETPVIPVVAGDYFEVFVYQTSGGALNLSNTESTWSSIQAF